MSTAIARPAPNAAPASDGQPGVGAAPVDGEAAAPAPECGHRGAGDDPHAVAGEFGGHERAEFRVEGGQHLRQPFDHGHRYPRVRSASAISRPM